MDPAPVLARVDREEYPWEPKRLIVDDAGHEMAYLDEGTGAPILMLHGNPTWSFLYRRVLKGLNGSTRAIVPDLIGFGCSDKPRDPGYYSLERHIRNLTHLVRELDLDDVTLVCHDWGGPVGLGWAVRNPAKVKRLVLLNTWAMRPEGVMPLPWAFKALRSPGVGEILVQKHNLMVEKGIPMDIADKGLVTERMMESYRAPVPFPDDRVGILRFMRMLPSRPGDESYEDLGEIEAGLGQLNVPTHIVWSGASGDWTKVSAMRFARLLPQGDEGSVRHIPHSGHFLPEEAHEEIVSVLTDEPMGARV